MNTISSKFYNLLLPWILGCIIIHIHPPRCYLISYLYNFKLVGWHTLRRNENFLMISIFSFANLEIMQILISIDLLRKFQAKALIFHSMPAQLYFTALTYKEDHSPFWGFFYAFLFLGFQENSDLKLQNVHIQLIFLFAVNFLGL